MAVIKEKVEGRVFCGSDWHGDYSIYVQAKKIMQPQDKLYYLGDAFDRGSCPIKLFLALMQDPQVTFVMGNHEEFAYKVLIAKDYDENDRELWFANGGIKSYNQFYAIPDEETLNNICFYLEKVYSDSYLKVVKVGNKTFFLSHAGFSFSNGTAQTKINFIWDREHIYNRNVKALANSWIVHGHTPTQLLPWNKSKKTVEIDNYAPHKIDIDLATWRSKKAALLPLDDLDSPIYITSDENLNADPEIYNDIVVVSST